MVICNAPPLTCLPSAITSPYTLSPSLPPSPCSIITSSSPLSPVQYPYLNSPLSLVSFVPAPGVVIQPGSWKQSYGMEQVWQQEFSRLFSNYYPNIWLLQPVDQQPISSKSFYSFVDSAKVRFCCEKCGYGWTSMKGRVAFWYDFLPPYYTHGIVTFKMYGQQCKRCQDDRYEQAMWYPEEVSKVLQNLYNRVGQVFYGFNKPMIEKTRRSGKPRTPHNSDLCQACKDGLCADRK